MKLQLELLHHTGGAQPQTVQKNVTPVAPSYWQIEGGKEFNTGNLYSIIAELFGFADCCNGCVQFDIDNTEWKYLTGKNISGEIMVARAAIIQ